MTWLTWLTLALIVAVLAALTGLKPKGHRPVAGTQLMGVARIVLVIVILAVAYFAFQAYQAASDSAGSARADGRRHRNMIQGRLRDSCVVVARHRQPSQYRSVTGPP